MLSSIRNLCSALSPLSVTALFPHRNWVEEKANVLIDTLPKSTQLTAFVIHQRRLGCKVTLMASSSSSAVILAVLLIGLSSADGHLNPTFPYDAPLRPPPLRQHNDSRQSGRSSPAVSMYRLDGAARGNDGSLRPNGFPISDQEMRIHRPQIRSSWDA